MGVTIETECLRSEVTVCHMWSAGWGFVGWEGESPRPAFQLLGWLASLIPWLTDSVSSSRGGLTCERLSTHVPLYNVTCLWDEGPPWSSVALSEQISSTKLSFLLIRKVCWGD